MNVFRIFSCTSQNCHSTTNCSIYMSNQTFQNIDKHKQFLGQLIKDGFMHTYLLEKREILCAILSLTVASIQLTKHSRIQINTNRSSNQRWFYAYIFVCKKKESSNLFSQLPCESLQISQCSFHIYPESIPPHKQGCVWSKFMIWDSSPSFYFLQYCSNYFFTIHINDIHLFHYHTFTPKSSSRISSAQDHVPSLNLFEACVHSSSCFLVIQQLIIIHASSSRLLLSTYTPLQRSINCS